MESLGYYYLEAIGYCELYVFDCDNGLPNGTCKAHIITSGQFSGDDFVTGYVKNGLKDGRWERKGWLYKENMTYSAVCDFENGKTECYQDVSYGGDVIFKYGECYWDDGSNGSYGNDI